jgi:hypothetical protein
MFTTCSPSTFAMSFIAGTASSRVPIATWPAEYWLFVADEPEPAIVPPVARIYTFGNSFAKAIVTDNSMTTNILNLFK